MADVGTQTPQEPRVYLPPIAPLSITRGCSRCGAPFDKHVDEALWCPDTYAGFESYDDYMRDAVR